LKLKLDRLEKHRQLALPFEVQTLIEPALIGNQLAQARVARVK
jgi:hypothetical protein